MMDCVSPFPAITRGESTPKPAFTTPGTNIDPADPATPGVTTPYVSPTPTPAPTPSPTPTPVPTVSIAAVLTPEPSPTPAPTIGGSLRTVTAALGLFSALLLCVCVLLLRALSRAKRKSARRTGGGSKAAVKPSGLEVGNAHNVGRRGNQEDSFAISDLTDTKLLRSTGILAVVADGMGGLADGEVVSAGVTSSVMREFPNLPASLTPPQKLHYLVEKASDAGNAVTGGVKNHGGSTMVAALVADGNLYFASVGDSRICLVRGGGLITLTRAHVYETDLDRKAAGREISFEAASADSQRRALTSYIGMGELEHVDCSQQPVTLMAGDWIVLMTDGVFNELTNEEIAHALRGTAPEAAERIERLVLAKGDPHQDNLTAVLLRVF